MTKRIIYVIALASSVILTGCGNEEATPVEKTTKVPTSAAYRKLLEKRVSSTRGADINIMQEMSKFERATDVEKGELFKRAESFVK